MSAPLHAPHAHAQVSVKRLMASVLLALVPATLFAFWLHGWPAIYLWMVASVSAWITEAIALRMRGLPVGAGLMDGSAWLTAWLLALSLPPWAPWWIAALGSAFAILVVKHAFGGLGQNVFNPAMAARVMLLVAFPLEMTLWNTPAPLFGATAPGARESLAITFGGAAWDAMASATPLGHVKTEFARGIEAAASLPEVFSASAAWLGLRPGSLGESAAPWLLLGGLWLLWRGVITWHAPAAMLLGIAVPAAIAHALDPAHQLGVLPHLLSGGVILAAFFIVTDPVTSPNSAAGQFVFGLGVGVLTWIIRVFGGYPEGVAFAVLLMNAMTPVIDRYIRPRIYGRTLAGKPLPADTEDRRPR